MLCARYLPRLLHLGLLAFAVALLAVMLVQRTTNLFTGEARVDPPAATANATVVDVARGVEVGMLASIVQIAKDERIVAIDDQPVENDIAAGAAIAHRTLGANTYLDLTVAHARTGGKRRVLVLMH
jgi:hypothetical protein